MTIPVNIFAKIDSASVELDVYFGLKKEKIKDRKKLFGITGTTLNHDWSVVSTYPPGVYVLSWQARGPKGKEYLIFIKWGTDEQNGEEHRGKIGENEGSDTSSLDVTLS
jgi:hypothetical protein